MDKSYTVNKKRFESGKTYVEHLSERYSKLNVIRVDLAYKKPHSDTITLEDANSDIEHMFANMRSKPTVFGNKVGHIVKREYTENRGIHFHVLFFFDGQKVQKDAHKADQIGKYWKETITGDKGSYHNCHRNTYERKGIGMLEHDDKEKRKIFDEDVLSYLCKEEQNIKKTSKRMKAFVRGTLPKEKSKAGRPRRKNT